MEQRRSLAAVEEEDVGDASGVSGSAVYFAISCVLAPLSAVGIGGNILSIFVLQRDKSGRAMSLLLQALSVGNAVLLAVALFIRIFVDLISRDSKASGDSLLAQYETFVTAHYEYLQPVSDSIHMFIVYIVLMIAIERYLAAWKPLDRRHLFTRRRVRWYILLVTVASLAFNMPKLFEAAPAPADSPSPSPLASLSNSTARNESSSTLTERSEDGALRTLKLVYRCFYALIQHFIPMCVISYCNIRLIGELRKASLFGAKMRTVSKRGTITPGNMLISPSLFDRGTTLAFATITCYVVCETPMTIATLAEMFYNFDFFHAESFTVFYGISIRILDLSACFNLVLYYLFGTKFRTTLCDMFRNLCRSRAAAARAVTLRYEITMTSMNRNDRSRLNSCVVNSAADEDFNQIRPVVRASSGNCLTPDTRSPRSPRSPDAHSFGRLNSSAN